jgi:transketolase C-terminal domain/subunit
VLKGWIVQWSPSTVFITGSAAALKNGRSVNVIATGTAGGSSVQAIKIRWA